MNPNERCPSSQIGFHFLAAKSVTCQPAEDESLPVDEDMPTMLTPGAHSPKTALLLRNLN